jgi:HAE1 family hydrophobic/amphiphilic exporter-1
MMTPRDFGREGALPRFSLDRRITVLVLFLTALVVGAVATMGIPLELFPPGYTEPFLGVYIPWPDAPPKEVQDKVIVPLEDELSTVKGINQLVSVSRYGQGQAWIEFKQGVDMDVAYREVRDRIERARVEFPDDVDRTYIWKHDTEGIPVYVLGIAIDTEITDYYNLLQDNLVKPISRIDGVANVELNGIEEKEILIELDRDQVSAAGLNIYELAMELGDDNFTMASGTVREGPRKLMLRSVARFESLEALQARIVGPSVRLGDVAVIRYDEADKDYRVRANSKPAVAAVIFKEGQANGQEVSAAITAELDRILADPRLAGLDSIPLFSAGEVIKESLLTLLQSGMIGGCIAAIVLFIFLRRFRMTVIVSLSIPCSMMIGLTVMYFAGESLNLLSLLGLMLCVGLLVDNSVVVAENIHRMYRNGAPRRDACIRGAGEVALAITMSTLTTIVVFLPMALVEGPAQFWLTRLAIPVSVSLVASLFVALVFIPVCVYLTLPASRATSTETPSRFRRFHDRLNTVLRALYEAVFGRLNRAYGRMLAFFLSRRLDLVIVLAVVFGVTASVAMKEVKFVDVQEEERSGFEIQIEMGTNSTLEETEAWFLEAEKVIEAKAEELDLAGWFQFHTDRWGELQGWFNSPRTNDISAKEATEIVVEALPPKAGMEVYTGQESELDEPDEGLYQVMLYGEDIDLLEETAEWLEAVFVKVPGVLGLQRGAEPPPNEIGLVVDRDRAQQYQVNPQVVAGVVGYALRGAQLPKYYDGGKEIPVRVRFQEKDRETLTELSNFPVPTGSGEVLPLSAVTEPTYLDARRQIFRLDKRAVRRISLELEDGTEEETRERLAALTAVLDLPEGISFGANISRISFNDDLSSLFFAAALSVLFVFLLMGFLFESFMLPMSIILTIPLSSIGVYWSHFIFGFDLDFLGAVGIVLLIGVVVNNGIVFIDYTNRLRAQGLARRDALLTSAERRFRPIMMTAITTIGGMMPLAFAGQGSDIGLSYTSFAMTLIGGMTTATLLTLLVVPVFYTMFDDLREWFMATIQRLIGKRIQRREASGAPQPDGVA